MYYPHHQLHKVMNTADNMCSFNGENMSYFLHLLLHLLPTSPSAVTTKEITMPQVGKKKFSYSKTGKAKAKAYAKKTGYRVKRKK